MKRFIVSGLVVAFMVGVAALASADRSLIGKRTTRVSFRAYVGATPQQYDTLAADAGERVELQSFNVFADDSAQAPTLWVTFMSTAKVPYLRLQQAYTANQVLVTNWTGPWIFPKGDSILVYYNLLGATPGSLDTLITNATYRLERP